MRAKRGTPTATETITTKLFKAAAKLILPKKVQSIGRTEWVNHMVVVYKAMGFSAKQWENIYDTSILFYEKAFNKGFPIRFGGIGNIMPQKLEPKNLAVKTESTVKLGRGIYPMLLTNAQVEQITAN